MDGTARGQTINLNVSGNHGLVQVGFITQFTDQDPSNLRNIFLNVVAVRLNPLPRKNSTKFPPENNSKWQTITIPTGTGTGNAGRPGDLQIDLLAGRTQLQLFNTAAVRIDQYRTVELILDTTNPGYVVPVCQQGSGLGTLEGCAYAPLQLQNPGNQILFLATTPIAVQNEGVASLPIQLNFQINTRPAIQGQPYVGTVTISQANPTDSEAFISGTVQGAGSGIVKKKVRRLTVSAEPAGTNNVVATATVLKGKYGIYVPAPTGGTTGAAYDLFVSGGGVSFEATRLSGSSAVFAGDKPTVDFTPAKIDAPLGTISGTITDQCNNNAPISGATINLLIPPDSNSSADCVSNPTDCVIVATANSGNAGTYPLPGTVRSPSPFNNVPIVSKNSGPAAPYTMEILDPGYNTVIDNNVVPSTSKSAGKCANSSSPPACDYALPTSYLKGTLTLTAAPAAGTEVLAQVFAENQGTNNLVSALGIPAIIRPGNTSADFTINVPAYTSSSIAQKPPTSNLDLFAEAIDTYAGAADPYPGHTIVTAANLAAPTVFCATSDFSTDTGTGTLFPSAETMDCAGHGSITGQLNNPDINTFVEISRNWNNTGDVQLFSAAPVSLILPPSGAESNPPVGNGYSMCVPPDSTPYTLTRYEGATPIETPVPGASQPITVNGPPVPEPSSTPSPCPSTCEDANGNCPRICQNTTASPL